MSRLQELIAELCPDGVDYVTLDESCYYPRERISIDDLDEGAYVSVENLAQDFGGLTGEVATTKPGTAVICFREGDVLVGNIRPYLKKVWLADFDGGTNGDVLVFRIKDSYGERLLPEFVCMQLASESFIDFDMKYAKGAKMPRGDKKAVLRYRIPVPPIEVQREVVRILDEYTAAHDELVRQIEEEAALRTASLTAFCDHEISRPEFKRCPIHGVGQLERGRRFTAADYVEAGIPSIHYGEIYTAYGLSATKTVSMVRSDMAANLRYAHPGDVVIACTGENKDDICKAVAWLGDVDAAVHDDCQILHHDSDPRFIAYALMTSEFHDQKVRVTSESKVVRVSSKKLASLRIPLPPIGEQRVTANRLDEIFSAINDLIISLGKEKLNLEQQLTLFRNQLLSFPEKKAV